MITLDEIRRMHDDGRSDDEIVGTLKGRGENEKDVYSALSQFQIKDAVDSNEDSTQQSSPSTKTIPGFPEVPKFKGDMPDSDSQTMEYSGPVQGASYSDMEPSILTQAQTPIKPSQVSPAYDYAGELNQQQDQQQQYQQPYPQEQYAPQYPEYQPYQGSISTDVVSEIAEQVVAEKLSYIESKIEKAIDFRTIAEAKISSISDRLKRIESVLDTIQISILQKVGSYVNDVRDLKKEIVETQKSFSSLHSGIKHSHQPTHEYPSHSRQHPEHPAQPHTHTEHVHHSPIHHHAPAHPKPAHAHHPHTPAHHEHETHQETKHKTSKAHAKKNHP